MARSTARIVECRFPSEVYIGEEASYTFKVQNTGPDANYLAMTVVVETAPPGGKLKIYVSSLGKWMTIEPWGYDTAVSNRIVRPGETFDFSGKLVVSGEEGEWDIVFVACGYEDGTLIGDQQWGTHIEAKAGAPPPAPPPAPSWWWPWLALGLGVAGVVTVGAVVAYQKMLKRK